MEGRPLATRAVDECLVVADTACAGEGRGLSESPGVPGLARRFPDVSAERIGGRVTPAGLGQALSERPARPRDPQTGQFRPQGQQGQQGQQQFGQGSQQTGGQQSGGLQFQQRSQG